MTAPLAPLLVTAIVGEPAVTASVRTLAALPLLSKIQLLLAAESPNFS